MRTEQVVTIILALLVPVVTGVVGALAILFQDWRVRRSRAGRRKLALEDATRQVAFAAEWWKARQSLDPSSEALHRARAGAFAWLDEASALVAGAEPPPLHEKESRVSLRRLLLLHPLERRSAKVVRCLFLLCLGLLILLAGNVITEALEGPVDVAWVFTSLIFLGIFTLGLRSLAVSLEDTNNRNGGHTGVTPRDALLLRRLHHRLARIIRGLFYASLVWVLACLYITIADLSYYPKAGPQDLAVLAVSLPLAIGLRSWALSFETTKVETAPPAREATDRGSGVPGP
jgi:hypothetical protein